MLKKNGIIFCHVDKEDYWVCTGLAFKLNNTSSYEAGYNELKSKLESPEVINYIIEERCLLDDLFEGDETFKFKRTYWDYSLVYEFENSEGVILETKFTADHICLPE